MVVVLQEADACLNVCGNSGCTAQACAAIHDAVTSLAGKHHITTYSACGARSGKASS